MEWKQWHAEGEGERGAGPGHPRQGASKERNYKHLNAVTR